MQLLNRNLSPFLYQLLTSGSLPVFIQTHKDRTTVAGTASWYKTRSELRHSHQKTQSHKETKCCGQKRIECEQ